MSPLQRSILLVLADRKQGLPLHGIADIVSRQIGRRLGHAAVGSAFSRNRDWVDSDTGRLNMHSVVTITDAGREALTAHEEHREATHPMGATVEGRFFVFVDEVHVIRRHTMIVQGVRDAAEAEEVARRQCDEGMYPATMSVSIDRTFRVRPVREGHGG